MKTIEIELSDSASAVIAEMAKRGKVRPDAIARLCVENSLAQAIDRLTSADGDLWFLENARDPNKACRESWKEIKNPGNYATALGRKEEAATKIHPRWFRIELSNGYMVWDLNAKFRRILKPIAEKFDVSIEEFLRLYSENKLPKQPKREHRLNEHAVPAGFFVDLGNDTSVLERIARAAEFSGQTIAELAWQSISGFVDCCEDDMIFSPETGEPIGDECPFGEFLLSSHRWPVAA